MNRTALLDVVTCQYCGSEAKLKDSAVIYGRSYGKVFICSNYPKCDAYVGVHKADNKPLGKLANAELRYWKKAAHASFDPIWKVGNMDRGEAYKWMQDAMGLEHLDAHIGEMSIEKCKTLIETIKRDAVGFKV